MTSPVPTSIRNLVPSHLTEGSVADAKEAVQAAIAAKPPDDKKEMREERYTFPFDFTGGNGKRYSGKLTHVVPDMQTRMAIGSLRSKLSGGVVYETLDPYTQEVSQMVADLTMTLENKDLPEWAADLGKLRDTQVLYKLWEVTSLHEATFLGRRPPQG